MGMDINWASLSGKKPTTTWSGCGFPTDHQLDRCSVAKRHEINWLRHLKSNIRRSIYSRPITHVRPGCSLVAAHASRPIFCSTHLTACRFSSLRAASLPHLFVSAFVTYNVLSRRTPSYESSSGSGCPPVTRAVKTTLFTARHGGRRGYHLLFVLRRPLGDPVPLLVLACCRTAAVATGRGAGVGCRARRHPSRRCRRALSPPRAFAHGGRAAVRPRPLDGLARVPVGRGLCVVVAWPINSSGGAVTCRAPWGPGSRHVTCAALADSVVDHLMRDGVVDEVASVGHTHTAGRHRRRC